MMRVTARPDGGRTAASDRQAQADHVARQLEAVADRLCREFSAGNAAAAEEIRRQVREARDAFGSPKVVAYLPVLVERAVRRRLRDARDGTAGLPRST